MRQVLYIPSDISVCFPSSGYSTGCFSGCRHPPAFAPLVLLLFLSRWTALCLLLLQSGSTRAAPSSGA